MFFGVYSRVYFGVCDGVPRSMAPVRPARKPALWYKGRQM